MKTRIGRSIATSTAAVTAVVALTFASGAGAATKVVSVDDNFFQPKRLKVAVGDRVKWEWDGFVAHNVVVEKGPQKFRSKTQSEGTFSRVIRKPGVYRIVCTLHPGMKMKLTATPAPTTTTTTAPPTT